MQSFGSAMTLCKKCQDAKVLYVSLRFAMYRKWRASFGGMKNQFVLYLGLIIIISPSQLASIFTTDFVTMIGACIPPRLCEGS